MRISDWSSDVCSSDLLLEDRGQYHPRRQWPGLAAVRALPYRARDADADVRGQQSRALEQVIESRRADNQIRVTRTFPGSSFLEMASSPEPPRPAADDACRIPRGTVGRIFVLLPAPNDRKTTRL